MSTPVPTDVTTTFDDWARRGRAEGMERGHRPRAEQALAAMPVRSGQTVIDLGCGNGWATRELAERVGPAGTALGVDAAAEMVVRARESTGAGGVRFLHADFAALPLPDGAVDHAFSMEALYYSKDLPASLREVARVLRPGGTLTVCTDFYEENPYCHDWPQALGLSMALLSEAGWADALTAAGFHVEASFRCLDPSPVDPAGRSEEELAAELDFRRNIGALAVRARR